MAKRNASFVFIFVTVMIDMIGLGLIVPSLPDIMRRFVSGEARVSALFGYFIAVYALMQFIASPLLGALSDRFGRRPVLLVSLLMAGLDYVLMAFAPDLTWLFAGRVIAGLTGASVTVAMAYVADVSDEESRSGNFGKIGAAFGLGFIVGPTLGGLVGQWSVQAPFLLAAGFNLLNFLFGCFVLPESVPVASRKALRLGHLNPLATLAGVFRAPGVLRLAAVFFLFSFAGHTHGVIWALYTELRYGWGPREIGISLALVGITISLIQGWLTSRVVHRFGEPRTVLVGILGEVLIFCLYGLATQGWMIYAILLAGSVFMVAHPALQSLLTRTAPPEIQGELQGSLVSLQSLGAIINPLFTTQLFAWFSVPEAPLHVPGAPYFFGAVVLVIAAALFSGIRTPEAAPALAAEGLELPRQP